MAQAKNTGGIGHALKACKRTYDSRFFQKLENLDWYFCCFDRAVNCINFNNEPELWN